jgi:ATPase subunit of ABC transporter with duplicated ATPase domains
LLAGDQVPHTGEARLGARVVPGLFAQTHTRPDLAGRDVVSIVMTEHARLINEAMSALSRYELTSCARQPFETLSGGQQARLQILLLELAGSTLLLLDEPTDNLDLPSAEALQEGLSLYDGTVLAVTHDRWFARSFDRFLVFRPDGSVREATEPVWELPHQDLGFRVSRRGGCRSPRRSERRPAVRCRTRCNAVPQEPALGRSPCRTSPQRG